MTPASTSIPSFARAFYPSGSIPIPSLPDYATPVKIPNLALRILLTLSGVLAIFAADQNNANVAEKITPDVALKACAIFDRDPLSAEGKSAAAIVMLFADKSPDVLVKISPAALPWFGSDKPYPREIQHRLLAAFAVGNIRAQIEKREKRDHAYEGWLQVFRTYSQIKKRNPKLVVPEINDLIRKRDAGTLRAYADELEKASAGATAGPRT